MELRETINKINQRTKIIPSGSWNEKVKNVILLLGASRAGSTLIKEALIKSDKIAYLSGEEESWFLLTKNTFPFTTPTINEIRNKQKLLDYLHHDFGINSDEIDKKHFSEKWRNRLLIQFPEISEENLKQIPFLIGKIFRAKKYNKSSIKQFLRNFDCTKLGYYDLFREENIPYEEMTIIEQPPYIVPLYTRPLSEKDYKTKFFLFKCPQSSYRINIWKEIFPNAKIIYIHLTRGFAQSINGLIDGWMYKSGFHSYDISQKNMKLNINGYSSKKWWKFDLPPNWKELVNSRLEEVCLNQWYQANKYILKLDEEILKVKFEDFLLDPNKILEKITGYIGIPNVKIKRLPYVMVTKFPTAYRWHKRKNLILTLAQDKKVIKLMKELNYSMNQKEWA